MRKILSLLLIVILLLSAAACKEPQPPQEDTPPPVSTTPEVKDNLDYRDESKAMTADEAKDYLEQEDTDKSSVQYKEAVYTVNQSLASKYITESKTSKAPTEETKTLFAGIYFRFIEGEGYASKTVKNTLQSLGSYEKTEDGRYRFVFWDRTLAQGSVTEDKDYCLNEYKRALDYLLSDPNVIVEPIE